MASSVAGSDSDVCFLWEYLKEYAYAVPPRIMEDLLALHQAGMTTVDNKTLRCVQENVVRQMHCHLP
jgi:hypothetical protein